jgi:hypothetical protein
MAKIRLAATEAAATRLFSAEWEVGKSGGLDADAICPMV